MKKLLILAVMMSANVFAGERVILNDSKKMDAVVNEETVLCSALGYGLEELKINIAGLDGWTILDHSNIKFGDTRALPCMTAGHCKRRANGPGLSVDSVLQSNPRVEGIVVNRVLVEVRNEGTNEFDEKVCYRTLREELKTIVGGVPFFHVRMSPSEEFPLNACVL